jgi:hypothetical protein
LLSDFMEVGLWVYVDGAMMKLMFYFQLIAKRNLKS